MSEFQNLKSKNQTPSKFKSMRQPTTWSRSPGTNSSDTKGNEAERKVRCKICGFICDRERDVRMPEDSYAGLGISYGAQQRTGAFVGDTRNMIKLSTTTSDTGGSSGGSVTSDYKLYLKMNGTNGSTTFIDSSPSAHTVTANGNVQIDTSDKVLGSGSGLFDGTGDYLSIPDSDDFSTAGNPPFTLHLRAKWNTVNATNFFSQTVDAEVYQYFGWSSSATKLFYSWGRSAGNGATYLSDNWTPTQNVWYHITFIHTPGNFRFYVDGVQIGSDVPTNSGLNPFSTMVNLSADIEIGARLIATETYFDGRIDEFIFNGTALWTENFTPPTSELTTDAEEVELGIGDQYYNRDVRAGCPNCASYLYDPTQPAQAMPDY